MATNKSVLTLHAELVETDAQIEKKILEELREVIYRKSQKVVKVLQRSLSQELIRRITTSPTWVSIQGGKLRGELGLYDPHTALAAILDTWLKGIKITFSRPRLTRSGFENVINIFVLDGTWSDVTALPQAKYTSINNDRNTREKIEWLKWLLIDGNRVLIKDYKIRYNLNSVQQRYSRTGIAIMEHRPGYSWKIPVEHQGTPKNNFVTRALLQQGNTIFDFIEEKIKQEFIK